MSNSITVYEVLEDPAKVDGSRGPYIHVAYCTSEFLANIVARGLGPQGGPGNIQEHPGISEGGNVYILKGGARHRVHVLTHAALAECKMFIGYIPIQDAPLALALLRNR